jgi:transglutaminase-like putative cysteine protease
VVLTLRQLFSRSPLSIVGLALVAIAAAGAAPPELVPAVVLAFGLVVTALAMRWREPWPAVGFVALGLVVTARGSSVRTGESLGWIALWVVGAVAAWAGVEVARMGSERRLSGSTPRARMTRFDKGAAAVIAVVCLVALLLSAVANFDLSSSLARPQQSRPGQAAGQVGTDLAPYVGLNDQLDTSARGKPGNDVVLHVRAAAPDFWRGSAFDQYDGRVWHQSAALQAVGVGDDVFGFNGNASRPGLAVPGEDFLRQSVRVEAPAIGLVFGAMRVGQVNLPDDTYEFRADGSISLDTPLGKGAEYTVSSMRVLTTSDSLRTNDPRTFGMSSEVERLYVQSGGATPKVAALAAQVAGDAPSTYDAVLALEAWLGENTKYTLNIPPLPDGADAVEQFLFVDQRGFCVQIASSLAVMLRSLGIPARLASGFVPGKESLAGGEFTVRASDAHAWVEVWFPGIGWQGFDPTARVPLAGEYSNSSLARIERFLGRIAVVLIIIGVVVAAIVAAWWLLRKRPPRRPTPWVSRFYGQVEKEGAKRGRPRAPDETPQRYAEALAASVLPHPELVTVGAIVSAAAYSGEEPNEQERAEAERVFALAREMKPRREIPD